MGTLTKMVFLYKALITLLLLVSHTHSAPQMERMGQPIADAYQAVESVVGKALNVVFQLSSWFVQYETAPYTHIQTIQGGLEERLYPARKWVCTKQTNRQTEEQDNSGMFWLLFKYIQGANTMDTKIEMTTPVSTLVTKDNLAATVTLEMCFYIGEAHQSNTPIPNNPRVYVKQDQERRVYTRQKGGWMNKEKWEQEAGNVERILTEKGVGFSDTSYYQVGYDAPSKMWNRRNEVWFVSLE